eukprot:g19501.t1
MRIGHDGTPLGVTVTADGSRAKGRHKHNGEVFVTTCRACVRSATSAAAKIVRVPVDLILLGKKTAGHIFPHIENVIRMVQKCVRGSGEQGARRPFIVYQVMDSGGANRRIRRLLRTWHGLEAARDGRAGSFSQIAGVSQYCFYHFGQLAVTDEVKLLVGKGEAFKNWCHRLYVFSRKVVYHKCDLIEQCEEWVREVFQSAAADGTFVGAWSLGGANTVAVEDATDVLFRLLGESVAVKKADGSRSTGTQARYFAEEKKLIGDSPEEVARILELILGKVSVGTESRWPSLGKSIGVLLLFSLLGGKDLVGRGEQEGFRKSVVSSWSAVLDKTAVAVFLASRPADAVMAEALRRGTLLPGEALRSRLRDLFAAGWNEVRSILPQLGSIGEACVDVQAAAASVVRVAMRTERRGMAIDVDGVLLPLLDLVDDDAPAESFKRFASLELGDDWEGVQVMSESSLRELAKTVAAVFTLGTKEEESQHATASKKVGLHTHRRTREGLSQEVIIPQFGAEILGAGPKLAKIVKKKTKMPQKASARALFQGERTRAAIAKTICDRPEMRDSAFGQQRLLQAREEMALASEAWEKRPDVEKQRLQLALKRQRKEDADAAEVGREMERREDAMGGAVKFYLAGVGWCSSTVDDEPKPKKARAIPSASGAGTEVPDAHTTAAGASSCASLRGGHAAETPLPQLPIPVQKLREYWTQTDAEVEAARRAACSTPLPWSNIELKEEFAKTKPAPARRLHKLEKVFLDAEAHFGQDRLIGVLFGREQESRQLLPPGGSAGADSGGVSPPVGLRLFVATSTNGHQRGVTFLPLVSRNIGVCPGEYYGTIPDSTTCQTLDYREVFRQLDTTKDGCWIGPLEFLSVSAAFRLNWSDCIDAEEVPAPEGDDDSEDSEELEAEEESDSEDEDAEAAALNFAQQIRERELQEYLQSGACGGRVAHWEKSSAELLSGTRSAGLQSGVTGAATNAQGRAEHKRGNAPGGGEHAHRGEAGYRENEEDTAAKLQAARAALDEIPRGELVQNGYCVRLNGGLWLRADTKKGRPGHRPWMPDDGIAFSSVICYGPAGAHRSCGMQLSKQLDINKHGGRTICHHLCLLWARAAHFVCDAIAAGTKLPECRDIELVKQRLRDHVDEELEYLKVVTQDPDPDERAEAAGKGEKLTAAQIQNRASQSVDTEIIKPLASFLNSKTQ